MFFLLHSDGSGQQELDKIRIRMKTYNLLNNVSSSSSLSIPELWFLHLTDTCRQTTSLFTITVPKQPSQWAIVWVLVPYLEYIEFGRITDLTLLFIPPLTNTPTPPHSLTCCTYSTSTNVKLEYEHKKIYSSLVTQGSAAGLVFLTGVSGISLNPGFLTQCYEFLNFLTFELTWMIF